MIPKSILKKLGQQHVKEQPKAEWVGLMAEQQKIAVQQLAAWQEAVTQEQKKKLEEEWIDYMNQLKKNYQWNYIASKAISAEKIVSGSFVVTSGSTATASGVVVTLDPPAPEPEPFLRVTVDG